MNNTGYEVTFNYRCGFNGASVVVAINGSDKSKGTYNKTIPAANYTIDSNTGIIRNATIMEYENVTFNYTYNWGQQACEAANSTTAGLGTFGDFWEIIVLAIVISVVLGLLLVIFGGTGRRR